MEQNSVSDLQYITFYSLMHADAIFRKTDMKLDQATATRPQGSDVGWEVLLSHDMRTGTTLGFCKGTLWHDQLPTRLDKSIATLLDGELRPDQLCHPMLLPIIIFSHEIDGRIKEKQKEAAEEVKELTRAIKDFWRRKLNSPGEPMGEQIAEFHGRIVVCNHWILWKRPARYLEVVEDMHSALLTFFAGLDPDRQMFLQAVQTELLGRATFYRSKLKALRASADRTGAKL
jgi:hypothetical protein